MLYLYYILLGLLPSIIWLAFYLRKDKHPEPNSMILKIFIWGMLLTPLAAFLEIIIIWLINPGVDLTTLLSGGMPRTFLNIVLVSALVPAVIEESLKLSIVKAKIIKNKEFDEPVDAMLYCIIAALGFAAVENLLVLFKTPLIPLSEAVGIMTIRFLGATLVHAVASGIAGYFLAMGLLHSQKRKRLILTGLSIAIIFHACYNYLIEQIARANEIGQSIYLLLLIALMIIMATMVSNCFRKLKKQASVCKISED